MVMKHEEQLKKLNVQYHKTVKKDEDLDEVPSLTGQKLTFCLTCGNGADAKMKSKYSPQKSDKYKNKRPMSGFKSTQ